MSPTKKKEGKEGPSKVRRRTKAILLPYLVAVALSCCAIFLATSSHTAPKDREDHPLMWTAPLSGTYVRQLGGISHLNSKSDPIIHPLEVMWVYNETNPLWRVIPSHRPSIPEDDMLQYHQEVENFLEAIDDKMDIDLYHNEEILFEPDEQDPTQKCYRPNWVWNYYPNCNQFHEIAIPDSLSFNAPDNAAIQALGQGASRQAWLLEKSDSSTVVLKTLRTKRLEDTKAEVGHLRKVQTEALIMERLSASDRIMNIFGHCGGSTLVEPAADIYELIVPNQDRPQVTSAQDVPLTPQNNFTVLEKLDMAIAMAEGIAEMHGYEGGVMVNSDIHIEQWVRSQIDHKIKLNDFNNAFFLNFNPQTQQYCSTYISYGGDFHSPEEFRGDYVEEAIDVYSMGNNIHCLLTGLWQFPWLEEDSDVQALVLDGKRDHVSFGEKTPSLIERRLVEIMEQAWIHNPKERVSIFEMVQHLRETRRMYDEQQTQQAKDLG